MKNLYGLKNEINKNDIFMSVGDIFTWRQLKGKNTCILWKIRYNKTSVVENTCFFDKDNSIRQFVTILSINKTRDCKLKYARAYFYFVVV